MSQTIDLKVGFSCNNNCIHCVVSDKINERDLSFNEIKQLVSEYVCEFGTIELTLTGGEVTIREDFFELMLFVKEMKDAGHIISADMQTNGRMLSIDEYAIAAAQAMDFFLVAMHSCHAETHDAITMVKGSFNQTTRAIHNLKRYAGIDKIAIQTVINRLNFDHLPAIYKFVHDNLGLKECNLTFPHPIGVCQSHKIVPSYAEVRTYVNEALDYCLANGIAPYIEALPFCIWKPCKNRQYAIDFAKKRNINVIGYGGEKDGAVDYSKLFDEGHAKYQTCLQCPYVTFCEGVWKEHVAIYPDEDMYRLLLEENGCEDEH